MGLRVVEGTGGVRHHKGETDVIPFQLKAFKNKEFF